MTKNKQIRDNNYSFRKTIKMLKQYLFNYKLLVALTFLLAFLSVVSSLLVPVYIGKCIDTITNDYFNISEFTNNALIIVLLIFITFLSIMLIGMVKR